MTAGTPISRRHLDDIKQDWVDNENPEADVWATKLIRDLLATIDERDEETRSALKAIHWFAVVYRPTIDKVPAHVLTIVAIADKANKAGMLR